MPGKALSHNNRLSFQLHWEILLAVLAIVWLTLLLTPPGLENPPTAKAIPDFTGYYSAARIVASGNIDKIYDTSLQQKTLSEIMGTSRVKPLPYLYPPQDMLFFRPLASLSLSNAFFIWQLVNIAATLALLYMIYSSGSDWGKSGAVLIPAFLIITFYPWVSAIQHGQTVILMTAGIWASHLLSKRGHMLLAAILLILAAFKPQIIIAPALYLLIIHGKKFWVSMIAAGITTILLCTAFFGISIWQSYIDIMLTASHEIKGLSANVDAMGNIRALVLLLAGEKYFPLINLISSLLWLAGIAATIAIALVTRNKNEEMQDIGFALVIALSCFLSPWQHVLSFILLIILAFYLAKYNDLKPRYLFIGGLVNFSLLAMFVDSLAPKFNSVLWVTFQIALLAFIAQKFLHKK